MDLNGWHTGSAGSFGSTVLGTRLHAVCTSPPRRSYSLCRRARMKAVVCEAFGGPEVLAWRDVPDPAPPGPGEIQVRIEARGVQYVDVLMLAGKYQFRPDPPFIPGSEAAGRVVAVGPDITQYRI